MRTVRCSGRRGGVWQTPPAPCEQNDWQTPVKILPCRNFVADGKNRLAYLIFNDVLYVLTWESSQEGYCIYTTGIVMVY